MKKAKPTQGIFKDYEITFSLFIMEDFYFEGGEKFDVRAGENRITKATFFIQEGKGIKIFFTSPMSNILKNCIEKAIADFLKKNKIEL